MAIIEIARYKLSAGADEQVLLNAEKDIQQNIAPNYEGSLGRQLAKGENGEYVLIMHWASQEAANGWNSILFQNESGRALGGLVDPTTMRKETIVQVAP